MAPVYDFLVNPHQTAISPRVPFGGLRRPRPFPQTTGLGRLPSPSKSTPWVAGADSWKTWIEIIPKITIPRHNARLFSRVVSDRRPSMKHLSVLGAAVRSGAAVLLMCAAFIFWGLIACGVYIVAMALGFHPRPHPPSLYWLVGVGLVLAGILYPLHKIANRP